MALLISKSRVHNFEFEEPETKLAENVAVYLIIVTKSHSLRIIWKVEELRRVRHSENDRHGKVFYELWLSRNRIQHDGLEELRHCLCEVGGSLLHLVSQLLISILIGIYL